MLGQGHEERSKLPEGNTHRLLVKRAALGDVFLPWLPWHDRSVCKTIIMFFVVPVIPIKWLQQCNCVCVCVSSEWHRSQEVEGAKASHTRAAERGPQRKERESLEKASAGDQNSRRRQHASYQSIELRQLAGITWAITSWPSCVPLAPPGLRWLTSAALGDWITTRRLTVQLGGPQRSTMALTAAGGPSSV